MKLFLNYVKVSTNGSITKLTSAFLFLFYDFLIVFKNPPTGFALAETDGRHHLFRHDRVANCVHYLDG